MFKHILLPTDGSAVAEKAVKAGLELAKEMGAKVTGYCALEPMPQIHYGDSHIVTAQTIAELKRIAQQTSEKHLSKIQKAAEAAGVSFTPLIGKADSPYEGIVDAAKKQKCDVIFMASHGRSGISGLVMGSVTQKVLAHSTLPVLVFR